MHQSDSLHRLAKATTACNAPKIRTVTTSRTTGTLSLRYVPRPAPAPEEKTNGR